MAAPDRGRLGRGVQSSVSAERLSKSREKAGEGLLGIKTTETSPSPSQSKRRFAPLPSIGEYNQEAFGRSEPLQQLSRRSREVFSGLGLYEEDTAEPSSAVGLEFPKKVSLDDPIGFDDSDEAPRVTHERRKTKKISPHSPDESYDAEQKARDNVLQHIKEERRARYERQQIEKERNIERGQIPKLPGWLRKTSKQGLPGITALLQEQEQQEAKLPRTKEAERWVNFDALHRDDTENLDVLDGF